MAECGKAAELGEAVLISPISPVRHSTAPFSLTVLPSVSAGVSAVKRCVLIPVATGMAMMLVLLTLKQLRPKAKYVLWPRIDQKSCFKCMVSAGTFPLLVLALPR